MTHTIGDARAELSIEAGEYFVGRPIVIRVRRRGHRVDLDDRGAAVELAGRPLGWLAVAERVVAETGMNVNRAGVVFVPALVGRDIETLARRLGQASKAVYAELLEVD